jgi:hypothetical protein
MNKHAWLGLGWSLWFAVGMGAATRQPAGGAAGHWEGTIETLGQKLDIISISPDTRTGRGRARSRFRPRT